MNHDSLLGGQTPESSIPEKEASLASNFSNDERAAMEARLSEETEGITSRELAVFTRKAKEDFFLTANEFLLLKRKYDASTPSQKEILINQLRTLKKKKDVAFFRLDRLNLIGVHTTNSIFGEYDFIDEKSDFMKGLLEKNPKGVSMKKVRKQYKQKFGEDFEI